MDIMITKYSISEETEKYILFFGKVDFYTAKQYHKRGKVKRRN